MTRHWTYRAVAAVLTLVLLFQLMPLQTLAATTGSAAAEVSQEQAPASIIGEDPSLRTRTQKHFRLSDGSFLAVSYGVPVHYQDDTGHWQEIDNTLTASSGVYRAENGTATAAYAATLSTGQLFAVTDGDIGVSMRLLDTSQAQTMTGEQLSANANAQLIQNGLTYDRTTSASLVSEDTVQPATIATGSDTHGWTAEELLPEGLSASIVYEDVFPGVDLKYTAYSHNIKEQIIVNERQCAYRYDFFLELSGLTPTLNTDGSISLTDEEGIAAYTIPAPYMEDSQGYSSTAVTYTLTAVTGGAVLTVEADAAWINAEDRSFPVSIDPTLVLNTGNDNEDIYAAFSMELAPSDTTLGRQYLYVGNMPYGSSLGRYRLFMHFHNLPSIPEGSVITDVTLQMYQFEFPKYGLSELPLAAYDVTTEKPSNLDYYYWFRQICWDTEPEYDTSNAVDYAIASATQGYRYWNLTELAKQWYAGTKDATIAIVVEDESVLSSAYGSAGFHAYSSGVPPILTVTYRSNVGIEPYYTYTTLGAGSAGTAYIADATGQLKVAKQLVSFSSSINPFAMSLVYNSDYFAANAAASYTPPSALGTNMLLGQGWTLDVIQRMDEVAIDNTNYVRYYDGDGTVHYFAPSGGYYYDEDGLGLKVQVKGSGGYTMTDDHGNTWTFTGNLLTAISDETGNQYFFNYTNKQLTSITQKNIGCEEITVARFTYDGWYIINIFDAAGACYTLYYTDTRLTGIVKNGQSIAQYGYADNRLTTLTDTESAYSIAATWSGGKVSGYSEKANGTTGVQVSVSYPNHSHTAYRSSGNDRTLNNADDLITHYFMDYAGRTANAYTTDVSGTVLGATNAVYTANSGTNKANNRTLRTATIGAAARQLMKNGGLEYSDSWTLGSTVSRSTEKTRSGLYSFKHSSSSTSAYITATNTTAYLTAGKTYTLSAYVNTAQMESCVGKGAYLAVRDSAWILSTSQCISQKTSASVNAGWERLSVTFTPTTTGYATVYGEAVGYTGTIYFDDFQLEEAEAPSNYNLIENGSMDLGSYGWTLDNSASFVTTTGVSASTAAIQILGSPMDSTTIAYQDVPINLSGSQTYVLSGWVKANAVPDNVSTASDSAQDVEKQCGLRAILTYSDSSVEYHYVPFNTDLQDWQFTSLTIVPKQPNKTVRTIRVVLAYEKNANTAYFDNISFVREAAQTMAYDGDGNLRSVTATGLTADTNTYSGGNLIKTVTGGNGTYNYTYDTTYTHRLKSVTNGLVTQSMGYDSVGNVTSTTLTGGSLSMATSAAYDATGNRLASVTDSAGSTVSYGYSSGNSTMWGLPTTVTAPNGTVTTTAYDSFGRVTQNSIANTASVGYTYSNGMLSSLQRTAGSNTQTYNFTYDSFGNTTSIKVGSTALASYTYASKNGLLSSMTYGNNATVSYTYDTLGRIKTETYADGRVVSYTYTGDGQLYSAKETKGSTSTLYVYTYDTLGRLVGSQQIKDGTTELRTDQTYNANNQLTKQAWQIGSTAYSETYAYNTTDGSLATHGTATGQTVSYSYDALRRISGVSSGVTTKQYAYRSLGNNRTTAQVASVSYPNLVTPLTFGYTYDAMGNIATYSDTGKGDVTYTYDAQGQLLKAVGDETYTYTYDAAGNLLTASDGTVSHSYTYGNTNWRDLLTAFDGESITYDAIGNPTSYYNGTRWTFGWSNGRQLTSASNGTSSITYTYTADGMRTSKVVDGVTYNYYYASGRLLRQTWGDNVLDFFYDAQGYPYAMKYNGTPYYYVTNLQGNVERVVNSSGSVVAYYGYDPYGRITGTVGDLAEINPLRYRGYYYDAETGLYYLQSRYYDPTTGRFINADAYASTGQGILGNNMFAYCLNNPIAYEDSTGNFAGTLSPNTKLNEVKTYFEGGIGGVIAIGVTITISDTFEDIAEDIKAWVEAATSTSERRDQHVYVLTDPANNYMVKYVGRTNDPSRRLYEHQHDAMHPERQTYVMTVLVAGLTKNQAKLLEQVLISAYTLDHLDNARREIAAGNIMKYYSYLGAVAEIIGGATESSLRDLIG